MPAPPTACRCAGSAIGSIISKRRPCCSEGMRARAAATSAGSISAQHDAGLGAAFGQHAAPGIDHQRMAEGLAAVLVLAALRGREHEAAVLDRARAHQHVPVRLAGLPGEGGRDGEEDRAGFGQRAIERGEAQVVADRQPEPAPRQVGDAPRARPAGSCATRDSSRRLRDRRRTCGSCRSARRSRPRGRSGTSGSPPCRARP